MGHAVSDTRYLSCHVCRGDRGYAAGQTTVRRPAGEQHEEAAGQRIDICSRIDVLPAQCFGRGVGDGRHDRTIGGQVRGIVECTSNSEVRQEDPFVIAGILWIGQQEIGGLDVAVHDAAAVCVVESLGNFGDDAGRPRG